MKYLKKFEKWSPKFNRTLQGAAALATSTNKPNQKKQSIEDYANRSISKEEFMFKVYNDKLEELNPAVFTIVHDPKFILKPIEQLALVNEYGINDYTINPDGSIDVDHTPGLLSIPIIYKKIDGTIVPIEKPYMLTFTEDGSIYLKLINKDWKWDVNSPGNKIRFVDRASIENFIAMAIQSITSSPEPGTPVESASQRLRNRRSNTAEYSGMTKEKQAILDLIQKIVLDKDMRSFTI
jgi:hypothetical protein